jgi:outer membrane cobalamin receptor
MSATLEVGGSYNYIRTTQPETEQRLPHHRADASVQGRPHSRLTLLARARYFADSVDRTVAVPGYALLDLTATATLSRELVGVLRVDDALNARPETRAGYFMPGRVLMFVLQGQWQ